MDCLSCGSAGKESACSEGDLGSIPGVGRSPGEGKGDPLQYSGLENSRDCIIHGIAKSLTWLSNFHFYFRVPWHGEYIFFLFHESADNREKQLSFQHLWWEQGRSEGHRANGDKAESGVCTEITKRYFCPFMSVDSNCFKENTEK